MYFPTGGGPPVIAALLMGRGGSISVQRKNLRLILGRPLMEYPLMAARDAKRIDKIYLSTDDEEMAEVARRYGATIIERPPELAGPTAQYPEGVAHALAQMEPQPEVLVSMHCNCGTHAPGLLDACVEKLLADPTADSCVSGIIDNSHHPYRVKKVMEDGSLENWLPIPRGVSNNRQALTPSFVLDGAARALRVSRCFPPEGQEPFRVLGNRVLFVENPGGLDVHSEDDVILTERYLLRRGILPV
ncbi:MAG: NTP transferase domain-containing protein [Acidobacteria bacterium]|nr:NTP transferase domain-containing protein [Acidobacteriota bacterium]